MEIKDLYCEVCEDVTEHSAPYYTYTCTKCGYTGKYDYDDFYDDEEVVTSNICDCCGTYTSGSDLCENCDL